MADGSTASTITVTLKDVNNNPASGKTVTLARSGGSSTISPASGPSNVSGVVTFTVKDTVAESTTYTATDTTDAVTITQTASVTFTAGAVTAAHSTVTASPTPVVADGVATSTITVTLKDVNNNPVSGKTVTLAKSGGSSTISAASGASSTSGVVTFTVTDTVAESTTYTANDATDSVTITQTAAVTFTGGPARATASAVSASPASVTADGSSTSTIIVTLKDANNNLVSGKTVTLAKSGGSSTVSTASGPSTASGVVTFTVKDAVAESSAYTATDTTDTVTITQTASVTFTAGAVNAGTSTVNASPSSIPADGTTTSTITVTLKDVNSNLVSGKAVTLSQATGSSTISAPSGLSSASGVVTFTVKNTKAETVIYTATDSTDSIAITQTATVTFNVGVLHHFAISTISSPQTAGTAFNIAITAQDAFNNTVTSFDANPNKVMLTSTGTLVGTPITTSAFTNGVLISQSVAITNTGSFTIAATGISGNSGVTGTSNSFSVSPGIASKLRFALQPSNTTAGSAIAPAATVQVQDQFGNVVTTDTSNVSVGISAGGTLTGTLTTAAVAGVATFSNVVPTKTGTAFTLSATDGSLAGVTSSAFNVTAGAPSQLTFGHQPTTTTAGQAITPAVTVQILDANGNLTTSGASVAIGISPNPTSAVLGGTLAQAAVNGVASFGNLSINKGGSYTLAASSGGLTGATSASFTINNPAPSLTSITPINGNLTQTLTVVFAGTNFIGGVTTVSLGPDITVNTLSVDSATQITASVTIAATAAVGGRSISVTNSAPGGGTATVTNAFTVNNPATLTTLASLLNPSTYADSVTFTATVTSVSGTPTGSVTFYDSSTCSGTVLAGPTGLDLNGKAGFTTSSLTVPSHTITSCYSPTGIYLASNGSVTQTVNQAATTTSVVSDVNPAATGQLVTFTATVLPANVTGTVTFYDGTTALGPAIALTGNAAVFQTSTLAVGSHAMTATYTPDGNHTGSTSSILPQMVDTPPVAAADAFGVYRNTTLIVGAPGVLSNDNDADASQTVTAVQVTPPTHAASFTLNADGSFTYQPGPDYTGPDSFTYQPNDGTLDGNTVTVTLTVLPANASPVAQNDAYHTPSGTPLLIGGGAGVLSNDAGSASLAAVLVSGPAHAAAGGFTLQADGSFDYTPAAGFIGADSFVYKANDGTDSNVAMVTIAVVAPTASPIALNESYVTDQSGSLTIAVAQGVLANDVAATAAALVLGPLHGTLTFNSDGSFTYTPGPGFSGGDSFLYRATSDTGTSNLAMATVLVRATTTTTVSAPAVTYNADGSVTVTVASAAGMPTGDVSLMVDGGTAVTQPLVSGAATFPVTRPPAGDHTLSASYAAQNGFAASSATGTLHVDKASVTPHVMVSNKVYDATVAAAITGRSLTGVQGVDDVSLVGGTAIFSDKNVGSGKTVTATGVSLSGAAAANYQLSSTVATTTADITARTLVVTAQGVSRIYDATMAATVTLSDDHIVGDGVTDSYTSASFADKNVGVGKAVSVSGIAISGTDAGNYAANTTATTTATITARNLTVSATGVNKAYDRLTTATVTLSDDHIAGDLVTDAYTSASFGDKTVAVGKPVSVTGISIGGTDASNYHLTTTTASTSADITARPLTVSATGVSKVYDATTTATVTLGDDRLVGDVFVDSYASAAFADANVGTAKPVSVSGIVISGADASNYTFNTTATTTADITAVATSTSVSGPTITFGTSGQVTVTVTSSVGTPGGTMALAVDGGSAVSQALLTGSTTFTISNPTAGDHTLSATYAAQGNYAASGATGNVHVNQAATTTSVVSDVNPAATGQLVTFAATVLPANVTGTVTFYDGTTALGPAVALTGNAAVFQTSTLAVGSHAMTATYTPDGNHTGSTSSILAQVVDTPPVAAADAFGVYRNTTLIVGAPGVLGNDNDADASQTVTAVQVTPPAHAASFTLNADGSFTYQPAPGYTGPDSFTYQPNDGTLDGNTVTVTLTVLDATASPVAQNDAYHTPSGTPLLVGGGAGVLGNDAGSASLAAVLVSGPAHAAAGGFTLQADGSFEYTPAAGFIGADSFVYKANDGTDSNVAMVTIAVVAPTASPIALNESYVTDQSGSLTIAGAQGVLTNDVAATAAALVLGPLHGTLTFNLDGSFTYTPGTGFSGGDSFLYRATSDTGTSNLAMATVLVRATTTTTISAPAVTYNADGSVTVTVASAAGIPTGDVSLMVDGGAAVTQPLVSGAATFAVTRPPAGDHTLSASYAAQNGFAASSATGTLHVDKANVTPHVMVSNKVYDATVAAAITGRSLTGVQGVDDVSLVGGTAIFSDKNVGSGKTVTATGVSLSGAAAANYQLSSTVATTTADITARTLVVTAQGVSRIYDATMVATVNLSDDHIVGDGVTDSYTSASFADKNVGVGKAVSVSGIAISGTDAGNYTANTTATTTANITARTLVVTAQASNKVYDGNTTATVTLSDDHLGNDTVTVSSTTAWFADKNVGNGKTVTVSAMSISGGADAGNYTLNGVTQATATANITARTLVVTATGVNKVYDATTSATVTLATDKIGGDIVTATYTGGTFGDKTVGTAKTISVTGISISGTDTANYQLMSTTASAKADITARPLTVSATGVSKVYDATRTATVTLGDDRLVGDGVVDSYATAAFADANVGTAKPVSVSGIAISGTDAGNYTFNTTATTTASITPATPVVTVTDPQPIYDSTPHSAMAMAMGVDGQTAVSGSFTFTYDGSSTAPTNAKTSYAVVATFKSSNLNYAGATGSGALTIKNATPAFSGLTAPTIPYGTVWTNLSGNASAGPLIPTGSVSISLGGVGTQSAAISATGTFAAIFATGGLTVAAPGPAYAISYHYAGDANFNAASPDGSATLLVVPANTATVLASSADPSNYGQVATFTATVSDSTAGSTGSSTGTVSLYNVAGGATCASPGSGTLLDAMTLSGGTASTATSGLPPGALTILACYAGDVNFNPGGTTLANGQTVIPAPIATVNPASLSFGNQQAGTTSGSVPVTVSNTLGTAPLAISSIKITGTNASYFIQTNTCPSSPNTLAVGSSCTVNVKFSPADTGAATAILTVTDDDRNANDSQQFVSLTGAGTSSISSVGSLATYAIFATASGCSGINGSGGATVDSFNSSLGPILQSTGGNVGTNGNVALSGNNTVIYGTASSPFGGSGNCSTKAMTGYSISGGARATGGPVQLAQPINYPAPPISALAPPTTNQSIAGSCGSISGCTNNGSKSVVLSPGSYGNLSVSGGTTAHVSAGTYIANSLTLSGNSTLVVDSGPVVWNLAGNPLSGGAAAMDLSGGSMSNPSGIPSNLQFYYSGSRSMKLNGGTAAYALVYAPNSPINLSGGSHFYGGLVGSTINNSGGTAIHYDSSLPSINAGSYLWFSSVGLNVKGLPASGNAKLFVTNASISFTANGTPYSLVVPNAVITFSSTATSASTTWDAQDNRWTTLVPTSMASGNTTIHTFLDGLAFQASSTFPGGIQNVTWSAAFSTDTSGVSFQWQWGAAVYNSSFTNSYSTLDVKPVDDSDPAGTPESDKTALMFGAMGAGPTGLSVGTAGVVPTIAPASASPSTLNFGNMTVGSPSASMTTVLSNNQSSLLTISGVPTITGINASEFMIVTNTCPAPGGTLAGGGGTCGVTMAFTPGGTGTRKAKLSFTDSANNSPQTVFLTGGGQ